MLPNIDEANSAKMVETIMTGDLGKLNQAERTEYYKTVCEGLGLNPLTRPFEYLNLGGKLILYAGKRCAEQLRSIRKVSITSLNVERIDDVYMVTAKAVDGSGRSDVATGAVSIGGLKGEALSNAMMKAETKAKNRATLSLVGLGMLDRSEVDSIPNARQIEDPDRDLVSHLVPPVNDVQEPKQTLPLMPTDGPLTRGGKIWDGVPGVYKKPPSKAVQRDLNIELTRLCEWAIAEHPRTYAYDVDVKEALKQVGITSWNAERDTEDVKRKLTLHAEYQEGAD